MEDLAGEKVAATTVVALTALAAVPADAYAIADRPTLHTVASGIDKTDDLMARHARQRDARKHGQLGKGVAVADAAGLDLDADLAVTGLRDRTLDDLERAVGTGDLRDSHLAHSCSCLIRSGCATTRCRQDASLPWRVCGGSMVGVPQDFAYQDFTPGWSRTASCTPTSLG